MPIGERDGWVAIAGDAMVSVGAIVSAEVSEAFWRDGECHQDYVDDTWAPQPDYLAEQS